MFVLCIIIAEKEGLLAAHTACLPACLPAHIVSESNDSYIRLTFYFFLPRLSHENSSPVATTFLSAERITCVFFELSLPGSARIDASLVVIAEWL